MKKVLQVVHDVRILGVMNLRDIYKPLAFTSQISVSLDYIQDELENHNTDLAPAYQRGSVWTRAQQEAFMGHLLQGGEVLPLTFHRVPDSAHAEVLDGKQRLEAILAWLRGEVGARLDSSRVPVFIEDLEKRPNGEPVGLARIYLTFRYVNLPWKARVAYYVRLNSAGTPHTPEQIAAALAVAGEEPARKK